VLREKSGKSLRPVVFIAKKGDIAAIKAPCIRERDGMIRRSLKFTHRKKVEKKKKDKRRLMRKEREGRRAKGENSL